MANEPEEAKEARRVPEASDARLSSSTASSGGVSVEPGKGSTASSGVGSVEPVASGAAAASPVSPAAAGVSPSSANSSIQPSAPAQSSAAASSNPEAVKAVIPAEGAPPSDSVNDPAHDTHHDHDPYHDHYHDTYNEYDHQHHHQDAGAAHHHDDFHRTGYVPPPPEEPPTATEEDGEGGPVKPFLDHLEDFRWLLIKCVVVTLIGMVICLAAGNYLMEVIKWPLKKSAEASDQGATNQLMVVMAGTNQLGKLDVPAGLEKAFDFGTNRRVVFELMPVKIGTNEFLAFARSTNESAAAKPIEQLLLNLTPAGGFIVAFQLAIYGGIVLASPFLIFFIGQFLLPALKLNEKRYLLRGFTAGVVLFLGGVSFCFFKLMPLALNASAKYSQWLGISADQWTAENYIGFVCKFLLGMGLGFEMPVVILVFVKLGVLNYRMLAGFRRYMIVINLVLGAVLTTPEVLTQVMMAIPLQILYEITVWIAWYWEWRERKREEKAAAK